MKVLLLVFIWVTCPQPGFQVDCPLLTGFPGGTVVKNPPANAGDTDSTPGLERSPGEGNGNPLHYSCLESPMDRGAWWAVVHGVRRD